MGLIEELDDGRKIDHSQYGDYVYDKKGKLVDFAPKDKIDHLLHTLGIKRVTEIVGYDVVDEFGPYRVVNIDLGNRRRYYLQMVNPSTKEIHYEGVPNDCMSVEAALKWRNQSNELPMNLT